MILLAATAVTREQCHPETRQKQATEVASVTNKGTGTQKAVEQQIIWGGKSPNFVPLPSVIDAQIVICLKQVTIKVFLTHSEKELQHFVSGRGQCLIEELCHHVTPNVGLSGLSYLRSSNRFSIATRRDVCRV